MGTGVNPSKQTDVPRRRLKKLRSVKVTNLDRFRLSMKRPKSRISQELLLPDDSLEKVLKQNQNPKCKFQEAAPNYMKATSCFNARRGPSQPNPGDNSSIARKSAKSVKRMYSLKKLRKLSSVKKSGLSDSGIHLNAFLGSDELPTRGDDFDGFEDHRDRETESTIKSAPARVKLLRSGSIKLTRVRSVKLSRRRWAKSRLDQASISMTDDEATEELSSEALTNDIEKTINSSLSAPGLKTIKTPWKMPSLRSKRRPVKKQSQLAELNGRHLNRATCSSALKSSKVPQADHVSGLCESENQLIGHVCPYTYCSLHGHLHAPLPPLKGFISTKRRLLKKQRSIQLKRKPKTEAAFHRNLSRMNQSRQAASLQEVADPLMLDTEGCNEEILVEIYAESRDSSTPESIHCSDAEAVDSFIGTETEVGECEMITSESMTEPRKARSLTIKSDEFPKQRSAGDSEISAITAEANTHFDNKKYANMWKLIYKHISLPGNANTADTDGSDCNQNQHRGDENQDMNLDNQIAIADSEKLEFNQDEAIEFVQQAVEEIFHLVEQSHLYQPINQNMVLNDAEVCGNAGETADPAKQDFRADLQQPNNGEIVPEKEDLNEGTQPKRQRSKGFEKLRKMIITAKFIKAVEKLRRISPQKPRYLPSEIKEKVERFQLRHLSMDERKNTEGWMLDFALQQVIAKLAPAQQRRVGMLVEAFERVTPETNIRCDPAKMPPENYTAPLTDILKEERSIAEDLDASVATANGENHISGVIVSGAREVDDHKSNHEEIESPTSNKAQEDSYHGILGEARGNPKQDKDYLVTDTQCKQDFNRKSSIAMAKPVEVGFSPTDDEMPKESISQKVDETTALENPGKSRDETASSHQAPLEDPTTEETNLLFDKEKFTNVWTMVYQKFIANDVTASGEKKVAGKEQAENANSSNTIEGSDSSRGQFEMKHVAKTDASAGAEKHELNQANAIQLVQEAIDELLRLHEQLSDQEPCKVPEQNKTYNKEGELCSSNPTEPAKEKYRNSHSLELKDTRMTEPERTDTDDQKALQRQTSKPISKLKKLVLSTKFIRAMEKLRKIRTCKAQSFSSLGSSEAEKVYLRHLSMDERRNSEEWMFDYALQQVISKLAPAQQRRVALLTQAFETFTPELEQMSTKYRRMKMQPEDYTASTTKQKNEDGTSVIMDHDTPIIHDDKAWKSDDTFPADASAVPANIIRQEDNVAKVQDINFQDELYDGNLEHNDIKLHMHNLTSTKGCTECCSDNIQTEHKEDTHLKTKHHSHQEETLIDAHENEQKVDVPKYAKADRKYSKMWQLIYQHVKSNSSADSENQTAEIRAKEDQTDDASVETDDASVETDDDFQTTDAPCAKLEITQSDAIKLVQEAVDGILQQCNSLEQPSINLSMDQSSTDVENGGRLNSLDAKGSPEEKFSDEEGNKSKQNSFQGYSKLKRAIICSKFIKAMEKMQKSYAQKKRCHYNPLVPDHEAEIVHLRQYLIDESSSGEVWMLDYALRQVIAKLAPVQQQKVAMLIEAFQTVGPNPEETSKEPRCKMPNPSDIVVTAGNEDFKEETSLESFQDLKSTGPSDICNNSSSNVPGNEALPELEEISSSWPGDKDLNGDSDILRSGFSGTLAEAVVVADTHLANTSAGETSQSQDIGEDTNTDSRNNIFSEGEKYSSMWRLIYQHIKSGIPNLDAKHIPDADAKIPAETDTYGSASDVETPCDPHRSSTDNENADKNVDSANTELQQKDAMKLVEEAVNDILQMQVQSCDDQSIDPEEKTREEDKARQELPRSYSVFSKVVLCKKFNKAIEKMKKSKPKDQHYLPRQPDSTAENVHLRAQRMDEKNCEEWMLDYALQQVIGKLAPTQKKKVSMLVEAFERVNPPPDSTRHQMLNAVA